MNITALTVKRADGLNNGILNMKTDVNKDLAHLVLLFQTSETKTPIDLDKISEEIFRLWSL